MTLRHHPSIIMYNHVSQLKIWYMVNQNENYSSFREVCRRNEFDSFYNMVKRC